MFNDTENEMFKFRDAWDTELNGPESSPGYALLYQLMHKYRAEGKNRTESAILILRDLATEIDRLHDVNA